MDVNKRRVVPFYPHVVPAPLLSGALSRSLLPMQEILAEYPVQTVIQLYINILVYVICLV